MSNNVKSIPDGYHSITPYLVINNASEAIDFYKNAFGAEVLYRMDDASGKVGHAELKIGDSPIMLSDEFPEMNVRGPQTIGGSPISMLLYVEDVDAAAEKAVAAGATEVRPVKDQFYGDRSGTFSDPFGYSWTLSTHIEDVTSEEVRRRYEEFMKEQAAA